MPSKRRYNITLTEIQIERLEILAKDDNRSRSNYIGKLIDIEYQHRKKPFLAKNTE